MVLMSYDIEEFTKTNATPLDTYKFRENILQLEMSIFVPKKLKVNQGYFNTSERAESMLKGRKLAKQRKLQDFFGLQLSQSDLRDQAIENYPTISLDSFASAGIDIQELKKKNGKLRNFFGSPTPGIPRAALVPKISSESIQSAVDKNELHKEIKSARTKKAKKLSLLLGNPISGLHLIEQLPPVTSHGNLIEELGSIMLSPDVGKSMDSINPQLAIKKIQQARLEKLSQVLGHRILAEQLVTSTSSTQSEHPRPLTQFEREVYKKKAEKLGRIFGTAVSVNDIIDYSKLLVKEPSSLNSIQSEKSATSSIAPEPVKVSQVNKVRKIYKILGSWPSLKSELSDREEFESGGTS